MIMKDNSLKMTTKDFDFYYGEFKALYSISLDFYANRVTALIGPSGCGKSTLLRCLNRMNDLIPYSRAEGNVLLDGQDIYDPDVDVVSLRIYDPDVDVVSLRLRVGMVFQKPNPFPKTVFENVAFGLRVNGIKDRAQITELVEKTLRQAALWDEVKNRLHDSALGLSGGQQQRLCIARALAVEPEVLLMDEPCSALDPIATQKIEELIHGLKKTYTIIIVTHNMQQAARVSDVTAFLYLGKLIEVGVTDALFTRPTLKQTEDYITGRFG